jgi:signal transduction histidine kinase
VSRIESGSFSLDVQSNVDLHNLISQVIEDVEKKYAYKEKANKVSILFLPFGGNSKSSSANTMEDGPNRLLYVDCDPQKISQVVFNLLDNAMKFTSDGKIVVSTAVMGESYASSSSPDNAPNAATTDDGNEVRVNSGDNNDGVSGHSIGNQTAKRKKGAVLVTVEDTGQGINSKIKDQLFEKFVTRSNQGTGLGLYLSKKIVEEHGGRIWFEGTDNNDNNKTNNNNNNKKNKDAGIDGILHHLGSDKRIGSTFKFVIPVSLSAHLPEKGMQEKTMKK